ncbi:MAG: PspC domain-containing protein [Bacteroidota bacterium]|nr:PspC domain-containing protein [Bacteroidota bacterium]
MNTNISVTISGIVFHIDENAYAVLKEYLNKIGSYFSESEGRSEIIYDVESRIAEIFQGKINDKKQVIDIDDVNDVIRIMGKPEDFGGNKAESESKLEDTEKPFYRRRKLYRDIDNRWLGGVCAGFEHYFNINALWFRLAFLLTLFAGGTGILIYIILWIIIPKAVTTAEKLEMRGEPVNIPNIEKTIKEEAEHFKKKMKDFGNEAKGYYNGRYHFNKEKFKEETREFKSRMKDWKKETKDYYKHHDYQRGNHAFLRVVDALVMIIKYAFKALLIFIGLIFLFIGVVLLFTFGSSLWGGHMSFKINMFNIEGFSAHEFVRLFMDGPLATLGIIGMALFIGVPLIMLIYNGFRLVFNIRTRSRIINISGASLWVFSIILLVFTLWQLSKEFEVKGYSRFTSQVFQPKNGILYLSTSGIGKWTYYDHSDSTTSMRNVKFGALNDSLVSTGTPEIKIERSMNDSFQLEVIRSAYGQNLQDAGRRARGIVFNVVQRDSVFKIDNYTTFRKTDKWRAQTTEVIIRIPLRKEIIMPRSMYNMMIEDNENAGSVFADRNPTIRLEMTENGIVRK